MKALAAFLIRLSWFIEIEAYHLDAEAAYAESVNLAETDSRTHVEVARDFGVAA